MSLEQDVANKMMPEGVIRILVIDDEEIVRASLNRIFFRLGFQVKTVHSAQEGLELLYEERFDLVIVDLMMPEMNGIQFLGALKTGNLKLPVIMITGFPTIQSAVEALCLGATDYITKPFVREEIVSPVQKALAMDMNESETMEYISMPLNKESLFPGSTVVLPRHSWAEFRQDGTFDVGVDRNFVESPRAIASITVPREMDMIEQGYVGIHFHTWEDRIQGAFMPLSGQVVALNHEIVKAPIKINQNSWILRIKPSRLEEDLARLAGSLKR